MPQKSRISSQIIDPEAFQLNRNDSCLLGQEQRWALRPFLIVWSPVLEKKCEPVWDLKKKKQQPKNPISMHCLSLAGARWVLCAWGNFFWAGPCCFWRLCLPLLPALSDRDGRAPWKTQIFLSRLAWPQQYPRQSFLTFHGLHPCLS